jgi:hypothetical protein
MTQLDQILLDDSEPGKLTPQQFLERWKPVLESLNRMFEDPEQADVEAEPQKAKPSPAT